MVTGAWNVRMFSADYLDSDSLQIIDDPYWFWGHWVIGKGHSVWNASMVFAYYLESCYHEVLIFHILIDQN
jgi:hypothetical protein